MRLNLKIAAKAGPKVQCFDSQRLPVGAGHSQKVKAPPVRSGCGSKDCTLGLGLNESAS